MPGFSWENWLWWAYLCVGVVAWVAFGFGMITGRKRLSILRRPPYPLPEKPPKVSILIPAKDEVDRIEACLESALAQDYPDFELIAIDDRSTDGTGQRMDEVAARNGSRLKVVHVPGPDVPPNWVGKVHAISHGLTKATGDWLLFVDSDVLLEKDVVRASMGLCIQKRFDLLSLLPRIENHTFWETLIIPLCGAATGGMYLISLTNDNNLKKTAFATGQFLLVKREAYDAVGGHVAIHNWLGEDVELVRRMKPQGLRPRLAMGTDWLSVRMYSSLPAILRGWARNFFAGSRGTPWRVLGAMTFMVLCALSIVVALAWGLYRLWNPVPGFSGGTWLWLVAAHAAAMFGVIALVYRWSGCAMRYALLWPLGWVMMMWIFIRALKVCAAGSFEWRGTRYTRCVDEKGQTTGYTIEKVPAQA